MWRLSDQSDDESEPAQDELGYELAQKLAGLALSSPVEARSQEIEEGYIQGAAEVQPSVVAFNTLVAGAGVVELLRLATAFAGR